MNHLHMPYLELTLKSAAVLQQYPDLTFLPLNAPRHVRTMTPCLGAVYSSVLGRWNTPAQPAVQPSGKYRYGKIAYRYTEIVEYRYEK